MSARPEPFVTVEQYLALDRESEEKHEYLSGQVYAMAGGTPEHNAIGANLIAEFIRQLKGRLCMTYSSDQRVRGAETGLYTYPDVTVVCGEPTFEGDTLLNPTLVVEVLSPSSEGYDRGEKFAHYRRLEALREVVFVAQDRVRVERYVRQGARWILESEGDGRDVVLPLEAIGCELSLAEVYDKISL